MVNIQNSTIYLTLLHLLLKEHKKAPVLPKNMLKRLKSLSGMLGRDSKNPKMARNLVGSMRF